MFVLCENMKWNHLPNAGGLYDQHPELLEKFLFIFQSRQEYQAEEEKRQEDERKRNSAKSSRGGGVAGRRH